MKGAIRFVVVVLLAWLIAGTIAGLLWAYLIGTNPVAAIAIATVAAVAWVYRAHLRRHHPAPGHWLRGTGSPKDPVASPGAGWQEHVPHPADPQAPRPHRLRIPRVTGRRAAAGTALFAVVVVLAGYATIASVYMPLEDTGGFAVERPLYLERLDDPFGSDSLLLFCSEPGKEFSRTVSLRNAGPLPVTILAGVPGPMNGVDAFSLVDLAPVGLSNPSASPQPAPIRLAPGAETTMSARYRNFLGLAEGSRVLTRNIWVRYSVLGIERTAPVPLSASVGVEGGCGGS